MSFDKKIFVAGHRGMVGSAILRHLRQLGYSNIVTKTSNELNLTNQTEVADFFENEAIDEVYLAAARVGGIYANSTYPAEFIYQNLMIEANVIHQAYVHGIKKLLFLGSSCIYPKLAEQPMCESALLNGYLEPTNEPYAIAKIAGIKLCESYNRQYGVDYRSVMPTNLYGPGDNYHPDNSHVIPALIRRIHEAKEQQLSSVTIWGTGKPRREFLHVDDMAAASIFVMGVGKVEFDEYVDPMQSHINVGTGKDCSILEVAELIANVVGFNGVITTDTSRLDGAPRKLMQVDRLKGLGWRYNIELKEGLIEAYQWFLKNRNELRSL